ncbi:MAG: hypothetical protein RBS68_07125 [Anaerolineales bacterium]|jgi:hypothetical protein|nr:hypothetical protein [Anaerolineales bacterium]
MENHFHFFLPAAIFGPAWAVAGVKYVIGGSLASALHGVARATMEQLFQNRHPLSIGHFGFLAVVDDVFRY